MVRVFLKVECPSLSRVNAETIVGAFPLASWVMTVYTVIPTILCSSSKQVEYLRGLLMVSDISIISVRTVCFHGKVIQALISPI